MFASGRLARGLQFRLGAILGIVVTLVLRESVCVGYSTAAMPHLAQLVQARLHQLRVTALELGRDQDCSKSSGSAGIEHSCHLIKRQLAVRFD